VARIAFIGLGTMGLRMARHLLAAGHELVGCDVDPNRTRALGTTIAATPAEAVAEADVAVTSLPSAAAVEEVVLGPAGLVERAPSGTCLIEMSTSPPGLARRLADELERRGLDWLDAPVSGGPLGAEAATLAIMVGGKEEVFERHRELLELLGSCVVRVGGPGSGQTVKLCNNLIAGAEMAAIAEACAIIERERIDPARAFAVFTSSTSDSRVMRVRFPIPGVRPEHPASTGYEPMFALDLLFKDLTLALELAAACRVPARVAERACEAYAAARAAGLGHLDYSAVYQVVKPQE
jgi:3-hydroxyisobutyrate dehydrogenase